MTDSTSLEVKHVFAITLLCWQLLCDRGELSGGWEFAGERIGDKQCVGIIFLTISLHG